jgi:alpha-tubulin suppressor-like RCC1 family protein
MGITTGGSFSCALTVGKAYCWGVNNAGQLGSNSATGAKVPVPVYVAGALSGELLIQVGAGANHACALSSAGVAYCWGEGSSGALGDNATAYSRAPVAVSTSGVLAGKRLTEITTGVDYTCALDLAGAAYCWGAGGNGQLGNGSAAAAPVPVRVRTSGPLVQISAGSTHTCALDAAGRAYCWGDNHWGELGDGGRAPSTVPVPVSTGTLAAKKLVQISAGSDGTCALDSAGAAYCWGAGGNGQLGNGSTGIANVPAAVTTRGALAGKTLAQVNAGSSDACALDTAGRAYCWGTGGNGQLGNGSATTSSVPVAVTTSGALAGKALARISAGAAHTCALDAAGAAYCWGAGTAGQLGDNSTAGSRVPVAVG